MKALLFAAIMLFSSYVMAHGSSHPSCGGVLLENDAKGYYACVDRQQRIYDECTASPVCMRERVAQRERDKRHAYFTIVLTLLAVALVILS